ncbi:MAG TPA: peptidase S10 [Anaerolineae bacterium]|nr:peptidase S10 [Anaerolineae bacterium]HQK15225.1 peptidase S10 [Anaerolineae bacterium]
MADKDKRDRKPRKKDKHTQAKPPVPREKISKTKHTVVIGGQEIPYTATAGTLLLKDEEGQPKASLFYVAYTRDDVENVAQRPITFSFNGGPGSSSVWLHMGVVGPRRVLMDPEGNPLPPPYTLVNNEYSLLDVTDLVFIDPVSTGYSRAIPPEEAKQFHGVEQDIKSVGEFIRLYTTRAKRWASPKFLIGESYGTTRAAGLSGYLQNELGMYLNGIMLVSSVLNFQSIRFDLGNDLPYILFLPTYAAAAWFHNRLPADLQHQELRAVLAEVKAFAEREYTLALMQGARLPDKERRQIVTRLARYSGLSETYIEQTNLRINIHRFVKELLRDERRTIGRFDARFKGIDRDAAGEYHEYDPSYAIIQGAYTAMLNDYLRSELRFKSDLPYEILTGNVEPWDYSKFQNQYVNVAETLRGAMTQNPFLRVFVANGYYDLATPFFATEYTFDHLELDPSLQDHVTMAYYEAGHMMYLHQPSLAKLKADLARFLTAALPGR